ncbi:membrane protein [Synechococcus sp. GFB01]|uniref:TerC family protein n=1 Tax=Synechococcus sp. GFB01 TaxID=1662190 RepID=UPI00064E5D59|nr:membrane protein [Synechococcus sp. GFB01]KMM16380.1 membrane protein [Synechococcus sp. GFB01]
MEAESIESLTPLIRQADQWRELLLLLPLLLALEAVLSADNAIALAAISRRLHDRARQETALNLGLLLALVFRLGLIITAEWVLNFWPLQLAAALYLLWLCGRHLQEVWLERLEESATAAADAQTGSDAAHQVAGGHAAGHHGHPAGLGSVVATLALTDLAFSIDSVAAAVAVSDRLLPVMAGGVIGVIALRLTAELFIRWLEIFEHLETAGYLAVGLVGVRLLLRLLLPQFDPPEWSLLLVVAGLFVWGFSVRTPQVPLESD